MASICANPGRKTTDAISLMDAERTLISRRPPRAGSIEQFDDPHRARIEAFGSVGPRHRDALGVRALCNEAPSTHRGRREDQASADSCGPRAERNARGRNHRLSRIARPSLRNGLHLIRALLGAPGLLATVRDGAASA